MTDAPNERWLHAFPDAITSRVSAHIDGESYFQAAASAVATAKNSGHVICITGWMIDVVPERNTPSVYLTLIKNLENAIKSNVKTILLIWDNPLYDKKMAELKNWANKLSTKTDLTVLTNEWTTGPKQPVGVLSRINRIMYHIKENATSVFPRPNTFDALLYAQTTRDPPNLQQKSNWIANHDYKVGALHEKNIFVLGERGLISFCGGIDINTNRIQKNPSDTNFYHDAAVEIEGSASIGILDKIILRAEETFWGAKNSKILIDIKKKCDSYATIINPSVQNSDSLVKIVGTFNSPAEIDRLKDRSARESFLKIIKEAKQYVYIEDQYMVNLDIADALNKKIKEKQFEGVILVLQDSDETSDIAIPNRKRLDFIKRIKRGIAKPKSDEKVFTFVINKTFSNSLGNRYHTGLHSKILIADDEIAVVGSCNMNRRSFTLDSETSAVIFGGDFVRDFRMKLWSHMVYPSEKERLEKANFFKNWKLFPFEIREPSKNESDARGFSTISFLRNYDLEGIYRKNANPPNKIDLDQLVIEFVKGHGILSKLIGSKDVEQILEYISIMDGRPKISFNDILINPENYVPQIVDILWDNIIDPDFGY